MIVKKKQDISYYSQSIINNITASINDKFSGILGYKTAAAYLLAMMKQNIEKTSQTVSNFDNLLKRITEIVEDHYREFIKKMYKQLYKMIQENN